MKFIHNEEADYISCGVHFGSFLPTISFAKEKGDWWRNDDDQDVPLGFFVQTGEHSKGYALAVFRWKLTLIIRNSEKKGHS